MRSAWLDPARVSGMVASFKDHFSGHAADYARARPRYPEALFAYLAALAPARRLAWDCATGNGQAALGLAPHFDHIAATDASPEQIAHALPHPNVAYAVARAERSGLADGAVDLVTVAQALHWLDLDAFYVEARRVVRPAGVVAAWSYGLGCIDPAIDVLVRRFHDDMIGPYWPPERAHVGARSYALPFPFAAPPSPAPEFAMAVDWHLAAFTDYLRTWSAVKRFAAAHGTDPVAALDADLAPLWGRGRVRRIEWPLALRVGINKS